MAGKNDATAPAGELDFDAWMNTAKKQNREVKLYANGPLLVKLAGLIDEQGRAGGESWGGGADLDKDIADVRAELEKSAWTFLVEPLDSDDADAILSEHPTKPGATPEETRQVNRAQVAAQVAKQVVAPALTVQQVIQLRKRVGEPEFSKLWDMCLDINRSFDVDTPTSRGDSGSGRS